MKIKKVLVLVVFLSAFLCACHANYSAQKTDDEGNVKTASVNITGSFSESIETTLKI